MYSYQISSGMALYKPLRMQEPTSFLKILHSSERVLFLQQMAAHKRQPLPSSEPLPSKMKAPFPSVRLSPSMKQSLFPSAHPFQPVVSATPSIQRGRSPTFQPYPSTPPCRMIAQIHQQIGRASCRGRVEMSVG